MTVTRLRPRLTEDDVQRLIKGETSDARAEAASRICTKIDVDDLSEPERRAARDVLEFMAADAAAIVRRAIATTLRESPHLPRDIAVKLAADIDEVAAPLIEGSPVLTDQDLIDIIRAGSIKKQIAVSSRIEITTPVVRVIVSEGEEAAVAQAARNDGAEFDRIAYDATLTRFGDSELVTGALIDRSSLPVTVTEQLIDRISRDALTLLARRHSLPPQLAIELADDTRERATIDILDQAGCASDMRRFVQQLALNGRLTPSLVLRGLCQGRISFFEHALAELSGVPHAKTWILLHDAGPLGLRAMFDRAELPSRILPAARLALEVYRDLELSGSIVDRDHFTSTMIERVLTGAHGMAREDVDYLLEKLDARSAMAANTINAGEAA